MTATDVDYAHTREAERRRSFKAMRIAQAARRLGLMPFELRTIGATEPDIARWGRVRREVGLDRPASVETRNAALILLEQYALAVPGISLCPDCDWPVLEVVTEIGKQRIRIDPFPHPDGTVLPVQADDGMNMLARIFAGGGPSRPLEEPLYRQHSRSCPESAHGRRVRAPKCTVCGNPLDAALAAKDPTYTSHPSCDPQEVPR